MTWSYYYEGIWFIKQNSGTPEEEKARLADWKEQALPLVDKTVAGERASVYT